MRTNEVFLELYGRLPDLVRAAVEGLTPDELAQPPAPGANTVGWLVWHLARVQDDHVADAAGIGQVWTSQGWVGRFGLPFNPAATGYGHRPADVAAVRVGSGELLVGYHDAVWRQTTGYVAGLSDADLDRVVDRSWDPPVTLGVRLVSVIADDLQHAGQAAFVRGLLRRR